MSVYDSLQWKEVAHASYGNRHEYVYRAEYKNYFLYRNGKQYQIEEKGTEQTKWITKNKFLTELNNL